MKHESSRSVLCHKGHHKTRNIPHAGESNPSKFIIRKYHCCFCSIKYKNQYLIIIIIITSTRLPLPQLTKKKPTPHPMSIPSSNTQQIREIEGRGGALEEHEGETHILLLRRKVGNTVQL